MAKKGGKPNPTMSCDGKGVVMQTGSKANIKSFKPGYNYNKKLGK